jgi:hypothetical protein
MRSCGGGPPTQPHSSKVRLTGFDHGARIGIPIDAPNPLCYGARVNQNLNLLLTKALLLNSAAVGF